MKLSGIDGMLDAVKLNRRWAVPLAGLFVVAVGVAGVSAASPAPTGENPAQIFVYKLAAILHISSSQATTDLKQAELQTIDQMLKDGKITQAQADAMKQRIQNGQGLGLGVPFAQRRGPGIDFGVIRNLMTAETDAVAKVLKLSTSALMADLKSGKKLSDLESAAGVTDANLRSAVQDAAKKVLDAAVKSKTITQAQEDSFLQRLKSSQGPLPFGAPFGRGFGRGFGTHRPPSGAPPAPGASPASSL
jgi:hypothetical protein